jgi:hypothetical protein
MSSKHQKQFMDEALIEQPAVEDHEGAWPSLLTIIGFAFLTFNSFMAVYRSNGDVGDRQHLHKPTIPTPLYHRLPGASVLIPQSRPVGVARSPVLGDQGSASLLFLPSFLGSACSFEPPPHRPLVRAHPIDYASWKNIPYT